MMNKSWSIKRSFAVYVMLLTMIIALSSFTWLQGKVSNSNHQANFIHAQTAQLNILKDELIIAIHLIDLLSQKLNSKQITNIKNKIDVLLGNVNFNKLNTNLAMVPILGSTFTWPQKMINSIKIQFESFHNSVKRNNSYASENRTVLSNIAASIDLILNSTNTIRSESLLRASRNKTYLNILLFLLTAFALFIFFTFYRVVNSLSHNELFLENLMKSTNDIIISVTRKGIITSVSQSVENMLHFRQEQVIGRPFARILFGVVPGNEANTPLFKSIRAENCVRNVPSSVRDKNGNVLPADLSGCVVSDNNKSIQGYIFVISVDSSESKIKSKNELDQAKENFISILSHELRSPLSVVKASIDIIGSNSFRDDKRGIIVKNARTGINRLIRLSEDITDIANIQSSSIKLNIQYTSIEPIAQKIIEKRMEQALKKNIDLSINIANNLPEIKFDPTMTKKIIDKLIENSIKYTADDGKIILKLDRLDKDFIQVVVFDTGCGIPSEKVNEVMGKFIQVEGALRRSLEGIGLGLTISKSFVNAQGGELWIESNIGLGTQVFFTLPTVNNKKVTYSTAVKK